MIHKLDKFYQDIYLLGKQIPKRDHFGIHQKIENITLDLLELIISAALQDKNSKLMPLNSARIKIEILKRLIRISNNLKIIENKKYIQIENDLIEISKMISGWIKYLNK